MSCQNKISTKSGTFTFYDELVTRVEAKQKCIEKGEILAPVFTRRDEYKITSLFKSNDGKKDCHFVTNNTASYWVGLDSIKDNATNEFERVFTNGLRWKEHRHSKIYANQSYNNAPCEIAVFLPWFLPVDKPFFISPGCGEIHAYFCFKARRSTSAESLVQENESVISEIDYPLGILAAAAVLVIGGFVGLRLLKRKQKESL